MSLRTPAAPPKIHPITTPGSRPLFSVMIPTYNCSNYLIETIESVLKEDMSAETMQIEVVDDCSTDADVQAFVKETGNGRVAFFRQEQNVGSLLNFETCLNRANGRLIHILHGDDVIRPGFYKAMQQLFDTYAAIGAAFTGLSVIDEHGVFMYDNNKVQSVEGILPDWLNKISKAQYLRTCSIVIKREVYEKLGGYFGVHYGEDWEMFVRIAANYPVAYTPKVLAAYRIHNNNISAKYLETAQNIKDIKTVIEIIQNYLPANEQREARRAAKENFATHFAFNALGIYRTTGNATVALKQAQSALLLYANSKTIVSLLKLYAKISTGRR